MTLYRIGKSPNIRAAQNRKTWGLIENYLGSGSAQKEELVSLCSGHDHKTGGQGFIDYCIKNEWLILTNSLDTRTLKKEPNKTSGLRRPIRKSYTTGVYMAYPTTDILKPIYRGLKTKVSSSHTKVGITTDSFAKRGSEYSKTFDGEVKFLPLAEIQPELLADLEKHIVSALSARFSKVGSAREWFDTNDHDLVSEIVLSVISKYRA